MGQFIGFILFVLLIIKSAIFSPLYFLIFFFDILTPINLRILKTPILDGLIFTFLILRLEFLTSVVSTIKKAAELMSEGIL